MYSLNELTMISDGAKRWDKQEEQLRKNGILGSIDTQITKGVLPLVAHELLTEIATVATNRGAWNTLNNYGRCVRIYTRSNN